MDKYHVLELIGEGSFGKVYKGRKKFTGQIVALKMIPKSGKSEKELRSLRREIEIMRGLHHENIIEMCDSYETSNEVVVVTDYAEGELFQILEDDGNLPEEQVQSIACHLVSALYYLHSHRILHRDMKPQNILLGKGGIVKLCDFGFARAMSMNTLVLTSIKGTPLYMAPELVEEKPYDHTADLWALGCILYELYTGTPPYYTNSIFQLVNMIIKDPVKWPKTMNPVFKDFLQGLLTKPPKARLSWPDLLHHPFVADGVKYSEEDAKLDSPFTQPLSASLILKKEEQAKKKAHPPGTSKILAKARKKAMEEVAKNKPGIDKAKIKKIAEEAWGPFDKGDQSTEVTKTSQPERPRTGQWDTSQEFDPTPRTDRISKDYQKEYPSIEIEGRRTVKRSPDNKKKNIENVKLDTEEVDSDDEWQGLIDVTDQENDPDQALILLQDDKFIHKLKNRLNSSCVQVHDGMLIGAARLRTALRVITNLVTLKCDIKLILGFCKAVSLPDVALQTLSEVLEKPKVKQQPWCQQILIDLVIALNAYFASEISWCDRLEKQVVKDYLDCALKFLAMVPKLVTQHIDGDLRLREQTLLCVKYLSDVNERNKLNIANDYYSAVAQKESSTIESLISCTNYNPDVLKTLTEFADGNLDEAAQRQEILRNLSVDCLASMIFIPIDASEGIGGKRKVAQFIGNKLATKGYERQTDELLLLLRHPDHACPVLKVVYFCCQVSQEFCSYLSSQARHIESLLGLLMGKVEIPDMEVNSAIETVLNTFSSVVILLQTLPPTMTDIAGLLVSVFLESTIASHTAAAALLFSQMVYCGVFIEVQPEEMLQACLSVFTDLAQICVRCPFEYGILDGLLLLLCELLKQSEIPIAQLYIECGIWGNLWHRVAQALQVINPETNLPIHIIEHDNGGQIFYAPDFSLVSPQGVMAIVQMSVMVFTKETYQCLPNLAAPDSVVMLTLMHLLNKYFLEEVAKCVSVEDDQLIIDLIQEITQLFCFPFAVDTSSELLQEIQHCLFTAKLLPKLLHSCVTYVDVTELETPLSLLSRLVMASSIFVEQFATAVQDDVKAAPYLVKAMDVSSPLEVISDTLTICSHLVRISPQHVSLVNSICHGNKSDYENLSSLISHSSSAIRSRTCSLLGNLMKHDGKLYTLFRKKDKLFQGLIACLSDDDSNVRKSASYAIGNAGYHSDELYLKLKAAVGPLVSLLQDPVTKTRANAASACGNFGMHSSSLCAELKKHKTVAILLDTACHDLQTSVQISAVLALRSLSQRDDLKKEMISFKAVEKLSHLKVGDTPRAASTTPRPHSGMSVNVPITARPQSSNITSHCNKLIRVLQG